MIENKDIKLKNNNEYKKEELSPSQMRLYNKMKRSYDYERVWNGKDYKYSLFGIMVDLLGKNHEYRKYISDEELVPVFKKVLKDFF